MNTCFRITLSLLPCIVACADVDEPNGSGEQAVSSCPVSQQTANHYTWGEVGPYVQYTCPDPRGRTQYCVNSGLGDMKASIGAVCSRNFDPSNCYCKPTPTSSVDLSAWNFITAASGTDRSAGANYLCVRPQTCVIAHTCKAPDDDSLLSRSLNPVATLSLGGGTGDFYADPTRGKCYETNWARACGTAISNGSASNGWTYDCTAADRFPVGANVPILARFSNLTVDHRFRAMISRSGGSAFYTTATDYNRVGGGWQQAFYWYTINNVQRGTWTVAVQIGTSDGRWHTGRTAVFTVP